MRQKKFVYKTLLDYVTCTDEHTPIEIGYIIMVVEKQTKTRSEICLQCEREFESVLHTADGIHTEFAIVSFVSAPDIMIRSPSISHTEASTCQPMQAIDIGGTFIHYVRIHFDGHRGCHAMPNIAGTFLMVRSRCQRPLETGIHTERDIVSEKCFVGESLHIA